MADTPRFHLSSVTDSELTEFYVKNGFVLVDQLITAKEQEEIRTDLSKINRGYYDGSSIEPVDWALDEQRLLGRYMYIGQPRRSKPRHLQFTPIFKHGNTFQLESKTKAAQPIYAGLN